MTLPRSVLLPAALALGLAAAPAAAADFPTLKAGQWEVVTTSAAAPDRPRKSTMCLDAETQREAHAMGAGMRKEHCSKSETRVVAGQYVTDSVCNFGNSVIRSHAVMTVKGDGAYRTETAATFDPPLPNGPKESKTVTEGRFAGACRDGLVPGDVVTATGQKINLRQLSAAQTPKAP